jgi:hypothetical protein
MTTFQIRTVFSGRWLLGRCWHGLALAGILAVAPGLAMAQSTGPARPGSPVGGGNFAPGCGTVTLAQCSDPEFLYETRCGQLQRERTDSVCASLLEDAMADAEREEGRELSVVPRSMSESGIDYVVPAPATASGRYYVPDLSSVHSAQAASSYSTTDMLGINEYESWRSNGAQVNSCREYVWERWADLNEFLRLSAPVRSDFRAVYRVAFGPASNPASIGTRHLTDFRLRGRDGRVFGNLFNGTRQARNRFYFVSNFPGYSSEFPPPTDVPGLLDSLAQRSLTGAFLVNRIQTAIASNRHRIVETWSWHRQMSDRFVYLPTSGIRGPGELAAQPPEPGDYDLALLGQVPQTSHRRYLDEELNELWRLQQRFDALIREWKAANARFIGSGWNVRDAGLGYPVLQIGNVRQTINDLAAPVRVGRVPAPVQGPTRLATVEPETLTRQRILDEMLQILTTANEFGCLSGTDSPCDWSTARFAAALQNNFGAVQDRTLAECTDFTGGNLQNILGLDLPLVDDPEYPEFDCRIVTGSTITAVGFEQLQSDVEWCRQMQIAVAEARNADDARARVRTIPELVDPATGDFVIPGIRRSRDESMGNDYFGIGYSYELGFEADINAEICQVDVQAVARARAAARVFGKELVLLDAGAEADTVERTVDIWARVASTNIFVPQELFDPIAIEVAEIEPLEFNLSRTFEKAKEQRIIETTIIVVVVPLSIEAGIAGKVGVELGLTVFAEAADNNGCPQVNVGGIARPFLGVDGYVEAAIDIFIAEVGIRGDLNLITVSLPFRPSIGVGLKEPAAGPDDFELSVNARLDLNLSTLSGKLAAYAEIGFCPFCYTGRRTLLDWSGPSWNTVLFNQSYAVSLDDLFTALGG